MKAKVLLLVVFVLTLPAFANVVFTSTQAGQTVWGYQQGIAVEFQSNTTMYVAKGAHEIDCGLCFGNITVSVPGHTFQELTFDAFAHPPGGPWTDFATITTTNAGQGPEIFWGTDGGPDYRTVSVHYPVRIENVEILDVFSPFQALEDISIAAVSGEQIATPEPSTLLLVGIGLMGIRRFVKS